MTKIGNIEINCIKVSESYLITIFENGNLLYRFVREQSPINFNKEEDAWFNILCNLLTYDDIKEYCNEHYINLTPENINLVVEAVAIGIVLELEDELLGE